MLEHILKGGPMMIPLVICSLISLAVVYDRWAAFKKNRRIDTRSLRAKVLEYLQADNVDAAIKECETVRGPIAAVMLAGLRSYSHLYGKEESSETMRLVVGQVMEEYSAQAMSVVNKRLEVLTTIGSGGQVSEGISEALLTTAVGLIVALLAVIPQSVFNRWSDEIELELEESSSELVEFILTHH